MRKFGTPMKTVLQLLDEAPIGQVVRMQIVFDAIAAGRWEDASFTLRNAAGESDGEFALHCAKLAEHCDKQAKH